MATKRCRGGKWHYQIVRKGKLPKPVYLSFDNESEGDRYVAQLEQLIDRGSIPEKYLHAHEFNTISNAIDAYVDRVNVPESDKLVLSVVRARVGDKNLSTVDYVWAEDEWIAGMKESDLSPSTIRHHVGSLARCLDWVVKRGDSALVINPLRTLPKRYASGHKEDGVRDVRLENEAEVMRIITGGKPDGRERSFELKHKEALKLLFIMGLESGMRLAEMHTLNSDQVVLDRSTIFLDKTKNGDSRQVPVTTVLAEAIRSYQPDGEYFFPWRGSQKKVTSLLSAQFSRIFEAAGIPDFTFHGLRHEMTCRLYERTTLSDIQIAKILGWKSLKMALRYSHLRGSDLSKLLW